MFTYGNNSELYLGKLIKSLREFAYFSELFSIMFDSIQTVNYCVQCKIYFFKSLRTMPSGERSTETVSSSTIAGQWAIEEGGCRCESSLMETCLPTGAKKTAPVCARKPNGLFMTGLPLSCFSDSYQSIFDHRLNKKTLFNIEEQRLTSITLLSPFFP